MKKLLNLLTLADKILLSFIIFISISFIIYPINTIFSKYSENIEEQEIIIKAEDGIERVPLIDTFTEEPLLFYVEGPMGITIVEAHNGRVRVKQEPAADLYRIAEKTGWIERPGQIIVNLPNLIAIWIEAEEIDIDGITR